MTSLNMELRNDKEGVLSLVRTCGVERRKRDYARSGGLFESPDVDGIDQLGTTCGGALWDGSDPGVKPVGGESVLAVLLLCFGGLLVLVCGCVRAGDGGCDGALLGVVPSGTRGDAMSQVVVELGGDGFDGLVGGL